MAASLGFWRERGVGLKEGVSSGAHDCLGRWFSLSIASFNTEATRLFELVMAEAFPRTVESGVFVEVSWMIGAFEGTMRRGVRGGNGTEVR